MLAEYRKRENYDWAFRSTLEDLVGKVDFSWVKSCVSFGTGTGEHEIEFVRRFMPNLKTFIAVEPDQESVKTLRRNFQNAQLPDVETTIMETSIENWNGVDKPFDVALFFNVIFHVESGLRQQLLQRLRTQHLNPGGIVMLIENGTPFTSSYIRMMHGLGYVQDNWYKDIAEEVVACGFRLDFEHDIVSTRDLSNPTEGVLKFIELLFEYAVSTEQIRAVITETYNDPAPGMKSVVRKLAVFGKAED